MLGLFLGGCSVLGGTTPTQAPIIVIATSTPAAAGQPTSPARPTSASAGQPTSVPSQPAPTVPANSPSKGTVTFAFDAFPTYYPGILIEVGGLLKKRGYDLKLVPFGLDGQNDVPEEQRWERLKSGEWDVLATTLDGFARQSDPAIGAITADGLVASCSARSASRRPGPQVSRVQLQALLSGVLTLQVG